MPRLLFEKKGNAVWISHLDLMRLFQRAFKRADLPLTHTQGYNPRPSVSIALPMSVGVESSCELLDFDLYGQMPGNDEIRDRLNKALTEGVRVLEVYDSGLKIKHLSYLACTLVMEYDEGVPADACQRLQELFGKEALLLEKKGKNGIVEQDIISMIRSISFQAKDQEIVVDAVICCQNPTLNPMQISAAVTKYLPELTPDFVKCCRNEIYDTEMYVFR